MVKSKSSYRKLILMNGWMAWLLIVGWEMVSNGPEPDSRSSRKLLGVMVLRASQPHDND